jgi:hypothetical protein
VSMGTSAGREETRTLDPQTESAGPGWRALLEALYEDLDAARTREQAARERLLAEERRELQEGLVDTAEVTWPLERRRGGTS